MKKIRKQNNKGFSLVELIIVIAIMAVLVGVLAPAYLRYVEKSRKSADVQALDSIISAMEVTAISPEYDMGAGDTMTATFAENTGVLTLSSSRTTTDVAGELTGVVGAYTLKSTEWKGKSLILTGTVQASGKVSFALTGDSATVTSVLGYSTSLTSKIANTTP